MSRIMIHLPLVSTPDAIAAISRLGLAVSGVPVLDGRTYLLSDGREVEITESDGRAMAMAALKGIPVDCLPRVDGVYRLPVYQAPEVLPLYAIVRERVDQIDLDGLDERIVMGESSAGQYRPRTIIPVRALGSICMDDHRKLSFSPPSLEGIPSELQDLVIRSSEAIRCLHKESGLLVTDLEANNIGMTQHGPVLRDWHDAIEVRPMPDPTLLPSVPDGTSWLNMSFYPDFIGEATIGWEYAIDRDCPTFEPAWEVAQDRDHLIPLFRSPDGSIEIRALGFDDPRDVCAYVDGTVAGVYVDGMAWVAKDARRRHVGAAMVVTAAIVSGLPPAVDVYGNAKGLTGYSEAGYVLHETAFAYLQTDKPMMRLAQAMDETAKARDRRPHVVPVTTISPGV